MKHKSCAILEFLEHCSWLKTINIKPQKLLWHSVEAHVFTNLFMCCILEVNFQVMIILSGTTKRCLIFFLSFFFFFYWEINLNYFNLISLSVNCFLIRNIWGVFIKEGTVLLPSVTRKMHSWKAIPSQSSKKVIDLKKRW